MLNFIFLIQKKKFWRKVNNKIFENISFFENEILQIN